MELERDVLVSATEDVRVIEGELVAMIRRDRLYGDVTRNTVRRYLRQPIAADGQVRARRYRYSLLTSFLYRVAIQPFRSEFTSLSRPNPTIHPAAGIVINRHALEATR